LNRRANRLAGLLRQRGVGPDVRVGIAAERGPELVVGLLGILKAGGGYLPLDPKYPRERLAYMLEDSGVELLLSEAGVLERLPETAGVERLELMTDADWLADQDESDPLDAAQPQGLAYVIYTSGSTGQPKGVGVSHQALAMHCQAAARVYGVSERDRLLQAASISFDAAAEQLFMPLAVGARVVLGDLAEWDAQRLAEEVRRQGITMLDLPPAYAAQLESTGDAIEVRSCTLGGEAWDLRLLDGVRGLRAERWFNAYGPTEAVISPLIWEAQAEVGQSGYAPIGRPVGLRRAHLLSDGLDTLPEGLVGELFIGG
ncbi:MULTISPECIES: AMP-binding protein, partial [unclassified Pseudomonas]|uniref:AMP-binding protein n=1 Tax=unclassified Pseudomonas TaxID=196821 RepID=UPI002446E1CA